jgi:hypothetical protein
MYAWEAGRRRPFDIFSNLAQSMNLPLSWSLNAGEQSQ